MSTNAKAIIELFRPDDLAKEIVRLHTQFKNARAEWEAEMLEIRTFLYATDTRNTQVGQLPFKNSTTVPKLAHIATNLMAHYTSHLFSHPRWAQFEAFDADANVKDQKNKVEAYVRAKVRRKDYVKVLKQLLTDWINTGICIAQQRYVTEYCMGFDGQRKVEYQGAILERVDPMSVVFDVTATSFDAAAKIVRKVYSLGDIARMLEEESDTYFTQEILEELRGKRVTVRSSGMVKAPEGIEWKGIGISRDGFGDLLNYMSGDLVEVLEYYGDFYITETGEFLKNHLIVVVDRTKVIHKKEITGESGDNHLYFSTWEERPDNLIGMSPLARIVGMQYKLDKLENLRADVFDRMANPPTVEIGSVEFFGTRGAPNGRYVVDQGGDVKVLNLSKDALNADFQIDATMNIMEMVAGSPQNASGYRTPGEKTATEVQILDSGANRIFRDKAYKFEKEIIEPVLQGIVELGRKFLGETDLVSTTSSEFNIDTFVTVTREDLFVSGKMRARGSRLQAEKANALQNIMSILGGPVGASIAPHVSGKVLARALEELADFKELGIIIPNIAVQEAAETQQLAAAAQKQTATAMGIEDAEEASEDTTNLPPQ